MNAKRVVLKKAKPGRPSTRDPQKAGNQSTMVGLTLLQGVAAMREPASLTEIAKHTKMPISRAYRYLTTLAQSGFLKHDPETGKYDLGVASLQLGMAAMARVDAIRFASDIMRALTEETQLVSTLCVWTPNGPTTIKWEKGRLEVSVHIEEGVAFSLIDTATGRVFMTFLDDPEMKNILRRDLRQSNLSNAGNRQITEKALDRLRKEITDRGISCSAGRWTPNVAALSAPVFDRTGKLAMAITLIGMIGTVDMSVDSPAAYKLKEATQNLSRMLGAPQFKFPEG